jgi:glycosyltransferase involved in cell wall biosynthesis
VNPTEREPIRVAFVLHVMQVAGAEMLVAELIRRLGNRITPVVVCLDAVGPLGEQLVREGVPVVSLGRRPGLDLSVARRLARELRARRIEVIHAHQYTPFFYSALARIQVRHPLHLIFTEHGRHYPDVVSTRRRLANRLLLARLADDITGVCAFSTESLANVDGFRNCAIDVIENGIDLQPDRRDEPVAARRTRVGLPENRRYVICVARFHPVKDHATLLGAFAIVAARRPDTDLLLVGDGPLRPELERHVDQLGITSRVQFLGVRGDVPALLSASDVFALTSVSEAASLTLLEAMAAGLPVVVTNVGGNPEIVRSGIDGLLVARGDAQVAADALSAVLENHVQATAMGRAGRQRVVDRFRLDRTVCRYYERYRAGADRVRRRS